MTAAVILAAGASTRLGEPKQLVRLGGETMLDRAVRVVREAGCGPVVVVLGASAERISAECGLEGAVVVVHEGWSEGMGSSLRVGMGVVGDVDGVVVMTCDMPGVTAAHLRALMGSGVLTASRYGGRNGVPGYFPSACFHELRAMRGDAGARGMLREAAWVELVGGEMDVDTGEDLERAKAVFGG